MNLAYIDPTSGGLLVQLLLAGVAGAGVVLKLYFRKIARFFKRTKDDRKP